MPETYRADHVGSLLCPSQVLEAKRDCLQGRLELSELRADHVGSLLRPSQVLEARGTACRADWS